MLRKLSLVLIALLLIGLSGIAPSNARPQASNSFSQMLANVPDNALSRSIVWYGAASDLQAQLGLTIESNAALANMDRTSRFNYLLQFGKQVYYSGFSGLENAGDWEQVFGINSFAITREVTVGPAPRHYGILEGNFDAGLIATALGNLGYQQGQIGNTTVFVYGNDNDANAGSAVGQVAGSRLNRLVVSSNQIIAAPATDLIQTALSGGQALSQDPAYAALLSALEGGGYLPNSQLLCAVLLGGNFGADLANTAFSASGLSREQVGISAQLPAYEIAGIGYRLGGSGRGLVFALIYTDPNQANAAASALSERLAAYSSLQEPGRILFDGWAVTPTVLNAGNVYVAVVVAQMPEETDLAWVEMVQGRDIGFLVVP
jgi:hypothetical protein